jgi:hypothetical protein
MRSMSHKGNELVMEPFKRNPYRKSLLPLILIGSLVLGGCLPPKTVIYLPEPTMAVKPKVVAPEKKSPSEEEARLEKLIHQLEETEKRLLETQRNTEESLKKLEEASRKTDNAAGRIQKAQEKIEAIGHKEAP